MSTTHNTGTPLETTVDTKVAAPTTHYTTLWGGAGVVVSAVMAASPTLLPVAPNDWYFLIGWLPIMQLLSTVILAAAVTVLAVGVRGESGIVGASVVGKTALIGFAVLRLVLATLPSIVPIAVDANALGEPSFTLLAVTNVILLSLPVMALVLAGVVVVRARVLRGFARWGLLAVALVNLCGAALSYIPIVDVWYIASWFYSASLLLLLALGIAYLLSGQSTALRNRWKIINDAW